MLTRLRRRRAVAAVDAGDGVPAEGLGPARPLLVDKTTRTVWHPGVACTETLVETTRRPAPTASERVAELLAARDRRLRTRSDDAIDRVATTRDPAFLEMLMVELLRAARFERAFELLAPECRSRWLAPARFARAQAPLASVLGGVEVHAVRLLDEWNDPSRGRTLNDVAELDVDYRLTLGSGSATVKRTVHQVAVAGRWRVLLDPPAAA